MPVTNKVGRKMSNFKRRRYHKSALDEIPTKQGVYRIEDIFGNTDYIGKSNNLRRRMKQHLEGDIPSFLGMKAVEFKEIQNWKETNKVERDLIRKERPRKNKLRYDKD